MDRRDFIKTGIQAAGGLAASMLSPAMQQAYAAKTPKQPPNVIFFFSDQHRQASMPGEPYCDVIAPNLQKMSKNGVTFSHCFSNYPVCSPFRAMLISGRWPYHTGVIDNEHELAPTWSIGNHYKKAGYNTAYVGKWHLFSRARRTRFEPEGAGRHGFDYWQMWFNTNPHYDSSYTYDPKTGKRATPKGYNATLMTDQALTYLDAQKSSEKPFCLFVSVNPPHTPFYDAPQEFQKMYKGKLAERPNVQESGVSKKLIKKHKNPQHFLKGYYSHITAVDREIGRVMAKLKEIKQLDNTIVVYTSDHGEMGFSQGRMLKRLPWDESTRIPLIVQWPDGIKKGRKCDEVVSGIDFYPTLLGLCGLPIPDTADGNDFSKLCTGKTRKGPSDSAYIMHLDNAFAGSKLGAGTLFRGVRTDRYAYAYNMETKSPWILYDNKNDPYQKHNLVKDSKGRKIRAQLHALTAEYMKKSSDKHKLGKI